MVVRGAPAMGQAAAIGLALDGPEDGRIDAVRPPGRDPRLRDGPHQRAPDGGQRALGRRPLPRRRWTRSATSTPRGRSSPTRSGARPRTIVREAAEDHERLATLALAELPTPEDRPLQVLTHCNTGPLACGQFGTALGVVQVAVHQGRQVHVFVDETRPYLQGARLTAWELAQAGVGHTLIADAAAGWVFTKYAVDAVLVGADRIAANGDTANKIGTYPLAVLARRHGIPFYVCAPLASVDPDDGRRRGHPDRAARG